MTSSWRHYYDIKYSLVIKSFNELATLIHFHVLHPTEVTLVYSTKSISRHKPINFILNVVTYWWHMVTYGVDKMCIGDEHDEKSWRCTFKGNVFSWELLTFFEIEFFSKSLILILFQSVIIILAHETYKMKFLSTKQTKIQQNS